MLYKSLLAALTIGLCTTPALAQTADKNNLSVKLSFSKSDSSDLGRDRERVVTTLRYTRKLAPRASAFVYLYNANLDATNPFGTSDADINGFGFGATFNISKLTIATLAFAFNDNAEVFTNSGGPTTSDGDAKTVVIGLQRLIGIGRKSSLVASVNHAVSRLDQNFTGTPFNETRHITTLGLQYSQKVTSKTTLSAGAKSLFSNENITSHLVDQANYVSLGVSHKFGKAQVSLTGSAGIGAVSGDSSVGLKISRSF